MEQLFFSTFSTINFFTYLSSAFLEYFLSSKIPIKNIMSSYKNKTCKKKILFFPPCKKKEFTLQNLVKFTSIFKAKILFRVQTNQRNIKKKWK